ncbi:hypothetical protein ABT040_16095 [Streptomyces sp. NPDC002688]|uniref:hypothetical protein n=1 Tax=Streptomyces sp. NPDC002688 TaxID=3154423 RepID=UPI0033267517
MLAGEGGGKPLDVAALAQSGQGDDRPTVGLRAGRRDRGAVLECVFFGPPEWPLEQTLRFLSEHNVFENLLRLPETAGCWKFTGTFNGGFTPDVPISGAIRDWISGTSIPDLARTWMPDSSPSDPRPLELAVHSISKAFEHAISWTAGALVNLVNTHPLLTPTTPRLFAHTAWHIRHGVDTEQAITLLTSGITSPPPGPPDRPRRGRCPHQFRRTPCLARRSADRRLDHRVQGQHVRG